MNDFTTIITSVIPELMIAGAALFTIMLAAFSPKNIKLASIFGVLALTLTMVVIYQSNIDNTHYASGKWSVIFKLLATLPSLIVIYSVSVYPFKRYSIEFIALTLLALIGSFVVISARDFLMLFMGMELLALCGYILAAFNRSESKSSEAGLKYFALGALSSCLGLLGISFIYGFTGSIDYYLVAEAITINNNFAVAAGAIFVILSVLFKLSAAPFHMWTPDVYEGGPTLSIALFTSSAKISMLAALINLLSIPFLALDYTQNLLEYIAIFSMLIGALGGIKQTNVKRLMGYSTIMNMGFVLAAIAINKDLVAIFYLIIYSATSMAFLLAIKAIDSKDSELTMNSLSSLPKGSKILSLCAAIFLFSMAGIPPFSGFFAKFYIFTEALKQEKYFLVLIAAISSIIAAYYYLKMIRFMYFESSEPYHPLSSQRRFILPIIAVITVLILTLGFQISL